MGDFSSIWTSELKVHAANGKITCNLPQITQWSHGLPCWCAPSGMGQSDSWPKGRTVLAHLLFQNTKHIMWERENFHNFFLINPLTQHLSLTTLSFVSQKDKTIMKIIHLFGSFPKRTQPFFFTAHQPLSLLSLHPRGLLFLLFYFLFFLKVDRLVESHIA